MKRSVLALFSLLISLQLSFAAEKTGNNSKSGRKPSSAADSRSTIEFDEKVVEGMGSRDLSSARHTGENRGHGGDRLIREKTQFDDELKRALREVPWVQ